MAQAFDQDKFLSLVGGDLALAQELIRLFAADSPSLFASAERAIAEHDAPGFIRVAHRLRGNLRNFFAHSAAELAARLEAGAERPNWPELERGLAQLKVEVADLEKEFSKWLQTLSR